jgi:AhpD family alkylhydroperoxidase
VDYKSVSKDVIGHLYKAHHAIRVSEIDEALVALAELRVAQLVGCAYCCAFHSGELRQMGVDLRLMPSSCSSWSGLRR